MPFVLDTNIVSELRKGFGRCHPNVWRWYDATPTDEIYLSVLVLGEMRRGVEMKRKRDPETARIFERWLHEVVLIHRERIMPVTFEICDVWGRLAAGAPISTVDGLIAATAVHRGFTVATRNTADFQRTGVDYINPFEA
ncbi:MAG: type II toxin-antitoxin system VapC family toxin [Methylacidiphilales bacterium]|nr:type II toxin-antitoxin system VapC family toxin [Candidatus Methylacidiphilales bacterium]